MKRQLANENRNIGYKQIRTNLLQIYRHSGSKMELVFYIRKRRIQELLIELSMTRNFFLSINTVIII